MYAAAGGASLASRQARQRQRQNKKAQAPKAATNLPAKQPQQFPNYTDQAIVLPPRLSRVERNALLRPPSTATAAADRRHSTSNYHLHSHAAPPHSAQHRRLRESPSICIPVQQHQHHRQQHLRSQHSHLLPCQLLATTGSTLQLPQVHHLLPAGSADAPLERRCSFVRQVEEMEHPQKEAGILDRCHHMCNFEVKVPSGEGAEAVGGLANAEEALLMFAAQAGTPGAAPGEYERGAFGGSIDYPFSECSQGRTAWVERERGRRCSVSEEAARQQRLKQSEAHHRWMKRNRIHDASYGGGSGSSDYDDYSTIAYHQSAAANALLYVGLGTAAIGAIIFFVGTGEKGFKTLELRLIGPTLVACGLLCCLVRILLCACPRSSCGGERRKRQQQRKGFMDGVTAVMLPAVPVVACGRQPTTNVHQYNKERHKEPPSRKEEQVPKSNSSRELHQGQQRSKKKVCITTSEQPESSSSSSAPAPVHHQQQPSTSATCQQQPQQHLQLIIPSITEPSPTDEHHHNHQKDMSIIELVPLDVIGATAAPQQLLQLSSTTSCFFDMEYDLQSVSDDEDDDDGTNCDDDNGELLTVIEVELPKHSRTREPCNNAVQSGGVAEQQPVTTTTLSGGGVTAAVRQQQYQHSGIVLSPSQLQSSQQAQKQ